MPIAPFTRQGEKQRTGGTTYLPAIYHQVEVAVPPVEAYDV